MRITHIVETLERGGLERVVVDLCVGLRREHHDVEVLCIFRGGQLSGELEREGIPVTVFGKSRGLDVGSARSLRNHMVARNPDVIHAHNALAAYFSAFAILGACRSAFWINTRHGMGASSPWSRREMLYRAAVRRYDQVAFVCEAARRVFVGEHVVSKSRSIVLRNGIDTRQWPAVTRDSRAKGKRELNIAPDVFVVGSVGRLNWAKDYAGLVRIYAKAFPDPGSADRLVIVGEGTERGAIVAAAKDSGMGKKVILLGDRGDVGRVLRSFDVFACSSKTEGYSMALLEASSCGLPIVATDVGGNAEIVQGEYLVPPGDYEGFAAALRGLAESADRRTSAGLSSRRWALANADRSHMIKQHIDVYSRR